MTSSWTLLLKDGEEEMLEIPHGFSCVVTHAALQTNAPVTKRTTLSAHVESMRIGETDENGEIPATETDPVLHVFLPGRPMSATLLVAVAESDIAFLSTKGGDVLVSGHFIPRNVSLLDLTGPQ